jgi:hypothetical protein
MTHHNNEFPPLNFNGEDNLIKRMDQNQFITYSNIMSFITINKILSPYSGRYILRLLIKKEKSDVQICINGVSPGYPFEVANIDRFRIKNEVNQITRFKCRWNIYDRVQIEIDTDAGMLIYSVNNQNIYQMNIPHIPLYIDLGLMRGDRLHILSFEHIY